MKRYDSSFKMFYADRHSPTYAIGHMKENPDGEWVKHEDVIDLHDENEMLKEEVKRLSETHQDFETI